MKMCKTHWDALRQAIKVRGLFDFVASSGQEAIQQMEGELKGDKKTLKNYDPLMSCNWMIANNAMDMIGRLGLNPLVMLSPDPEHPEWECPICYLNYLSAEHDKTCTNPDCAKPKGKTFDDWIDHAADGAAEYIKTLK